MSTQIKFREALRKKGDVSAEDFGLLEREVDEWEHIFDWEHILRFVGEQIGRWDNRLQPDTILMSRADWDDILEYSRSLEDTDES